MIPAPKYRNAQRSCCWALGERMELWWFSSGRWALTVDANAGAVSASISIDLGTAAPAALLLLAHNRTDP